MVKRLKNNGKQKKLLVVIFIEGDTEVEFYQKMVTHIRGKMGGRLFVKTAVRNLKGINNFQNKAQRTFEKKIKVEYPPADYFYKVLLCYDTDVFRFAKKPPVDWDQVERMLYVSGATEVYHIKANASIEDWFLYDLEGIRKFLQAPKNDKIEGYKGQAGLERLFVKYNKTYIKGSKCSGLVDKLNMNIIFPKVCGEIREFCMALGMRCDDDKLCKEE